MKSAINYIVLSLISLISIGCGVKGMPAPPNDPAPIFSRPLGKEVKLQPEQKIVLSETKLILTPSPTPLQKFEKQKN